MISPTTETVIEYITSAVADGSEIASMLFSIRFPPPNVKAAIRIAKRRGLIVPTSKNMLGTMRYVMGPHWLAAQSEPRIHDYVPEIQQYLDSTRRTEIGQRLGSETASEIRTGIFTLLHRPTTIDDTGIMAEIITSLGGRPGPPHPVLMRVHITRLLLDMRRDRRKLLRARCVVLDIVNKPTAG